MKNQVFWLSDQLSDQKLIGTIDKYIKGNAQERWQAWQSQLGTDKFYLPVFGVQGCGKSTLLNALFFDDRVLPTDAQETTCVPAEIHYKPEAIGKAKVVFKDGTTKDVEAREDVLGSYINNVENPANEKGVQIIEVYSDDETLKEGLVLVDLPGIGGLTLANKETTMDYLKKSSGVVFLIRSVPPLTRSESFWVRSVWPLLPQAIFCQSCWDTESKEEIEDAQEHNLTVLSNIRQIIWGDKFQNPQLLCVNGEGALKAKFKSDSAAFAESGASKLRDTISRYSVNWKELITSETVKYWENDLHKSLQTIDKRLEQSQKDAESQEEAINRERRQFSEYKVRTAEKIDAAKDKIIAFSDELTKEIKKKLNELEMTFRNNIRTKLRAGIVDGDRLNKAFQAEADDISEQVYFHIQDKIGSLQIDLMAKLDGIEEWDSEFSYTPQGFDSPEKNKFENLLPVVLAPIGGVGGAILGAKLGAGLGASAGPAGAIVGGILGSVIGGLISGWLGGRSKKLVTNKRAGNIEPQVFSAVTSAIDKLRDQVLGLIKNFTSDSINQIDNWLQNQQDRYEQEERKRIEIKELEKEEKDMQINILIADRDTIKQAMISQKG